MIKINQNYLALEKSYLFTDIARKVQAFSETKPELSIIRLGIGDVTLPLPEVVITALKKAADDQANRDTFHGYGPEQGYAWLREKIAAYDFQARGLTITAEDIFVSDGAKCDTGNFLDILGDDITVAVADPVYPVYVDTNIMVGRKAKITKLPSTKETGFMPLPPAEAYDLIYLCSPNNPTGAVASREDLQAWVDYALRNKSLILFDAAYEAFIRNDAPHSIYEIPGAYDCAVEFRSYSKTAGFTGLRCGYVVIPKSLKIAAEEGQQLELHGLWSRRQTTKFNGASYVIQRAAEALYTPEGQSQCKANIDYYLSNASLLKEGLTSLGYRCSGGENSPYVWVEVPEGYDSWSFFDYLLQEYSIVTTPGSGFGACGEGYIRLSSFCSGEAARTAVDRFAKGS